MEIFGCPVWLIPIFLLLWVGCWVPCAGYNPIFCIIMIPSSTALSVLLWGREGHIVWVVPGIIVFIIFLLLIIASFNEENEEYWPEHIFHWNVVFQLRILISIFVLGWCEYFKPDFYLCFIGSAENTEYPKALALFCWVSLIAIIIGNSLYEILRASDNQTSYEFTNTQPPQPLLPPTPQPQYQPLPSTNIPYIPPVKPQFQPNPTINYVRYHHGTSIEAAEDVWQSGLWLSKISPAELWITDDLDIAKYYAKDRGSGIGYILVLDVDPSLDIIKLRDNVYYIELEHDSSQGQDNYYQVDGVYIIQMLDLNGNVLRSR
jgi:hypothetical protein